MSVAVADVERLDRGVAVVERVGPVARRIDRVGAVAVVARRRAADRLEGVGRVVDVGVGQRAGRRRRAGDGRWPRRPPRSPCRSTSPEITAASLVPLMVMVTTCGGAVRRQRP